MKANVISRQYSSSQSVEIAGKDVDYDMNSTYLQMSFLGISDESLSCVYAANEGNEAISKMKMQLLLKIMRMMMNMIIIDNAHDEESDGYDTKTKEDHSNYEDEDTEAT
nr:polyadenylate-binding protein-interacting protein 5 [Tanacetum cinerariifolium]